MIRVSNITCTIDSDTEKIVNKALKKIKARREDLFSFSVYRQSLDARKKNNLFFVYTLDMEIKNEEKYIGKDVRIIQEKKYEIRKTDVVPTTRPIIVGFGPAGMFAALVLAEAGMKPIVFERGGNVDERSASVNEFFKNGILDANSNVQFGEGGAGTFSDGKLTTRVKHPYGRRVLDVLIEHGAKEEIKYAAHPHIGTDVLIDVVRRIRMKIIELGGEIHFNSIVTDFKTNNNKITGVIVNNGEVFESDYVNIAIGHSARDTIYKLHDIGTDLESKEFAVGFRVEHKRELIDKAQYGEFAGNKHLGTAEYRLTHTTSNDRGVYTFCMCPGGVVVASSSIEGHVVTNGMSYNARDEENSNSAVLVQAKFEDFGDDLFSGIRFQEHLEKTAFELGGSDYKAPAQRVGDYIDNKISTDLGNIIPSYKPGVKLSNLNELFNDEMNSSLKEGLLNFDRKINGFVEHGILTGVESRTSSPIRILRDKNTFESLSISGLFPSGEGAGFAGGIMSAAIDGMKIGHAIIDKMEKENE